MQVNGTQSTLLKGLLNGKELELLAAEERLAMRPRSNGVITSAATAEAESAVPDQVTLSEASSGSSVMSRNFFNSNYTRSRYVKSSMEGHQSESAYSSVLTAVVSSLVTQASAMNMQRNFGDKSSPIENTYLIGNRLAHKAQDEVGQVRRKQVIEESQKNLDELQRSIEQAAANAEGANRTGEAAAPQTAASAQRGGESAPLPEAPAVQASPVPQPAPAVSPPPQVSAAVSAYTPSAPSAPSINISV